MSLASIIAFISVLTAFGVPQPTIDNIHGILLATQATTTVQVAQAQQPVTVVPVVQTPIVQNQPVYFGSVAPINPQPVDNSTTTTPVVVQSTPMDTTPPNVSRPQVYILNGQAIFEIKSDEPLDIAKSVLVNTGQDGNDNNAVTLGTVISDGVHRTDQLYAFKKGVQQTYFGYEVQVSGVSANDRLNIQIQDMAGNTVTKDGISVAG